MKYSEAKTGRTFIIRLEDGDILHEEIEKFATDHNIKAATLIAVGGIDKGSTLVIGPTNSRCEPPVVPMTHILDDAHEVTGSGTIFQNEDGVPIIHMHLACGRGTNTITGCIRKGIKVWHVLEVIIQEITNTTAIRKHEAATGFELLNP